MEEESAKEENRRVLGKRSGVSFPPPWSRAKSNTDLEIADLRTTKATQRLLQRPPRQR